MTTRSSMWLLCCLAATGMLLAFTAPASAQYPNKPVKLVVPFAAGGPTDALGRALAAAMRTQLGQPVIVENLGGAGGNIGAQSVAQAPADGYTLLLGTSGPLVVNVSLFRKLTFDPMKSFDPIIMIGTLPNVIVVHPGFPAKDIAELVAYGKAHKGQLSFAHAGIGGSSHLAGEMFNSMAGTDLVQIPYRGASPALNDLIGGQVQLGVLDVLVAAPQVKVGKIRALGVTTKERTSVLPDVPTLDEQGFKGFDSSVMFGVVAPRGTPPDILARLNTVLAASLDEPALRAFLEAQGIGRAPSTEAAYLTRYMGEEIPKWRRIIESIGLEMQ